MNIADKIMRAKEDYDAVYEAGRKSMVDESKIIEKTVSGSVISLDDVSEVPHEVSVQLSSDTVTDFSGVAVKVLGKNLFDKNKDIILDGYFGNSIVVATGMFKTIAILCETNTTYTVSKIAGERFAVGTTREIPKSGTTVYGVINNYTGTSITITTDSDAKYLVAYVWNSSEDSSVTAEAMLDSVLVYEPDTVKTYTASADGKVNIKTISPYMTITTDTADVNITATYHKSWGMQTEYDRFWDAYQQNGNRTDYQGAFYGCGWNNETFKPKYGIKPSGRCGSLFYDSDIEGDLVQILENLGISLDLSEVTRFSYGFYYNTLLTRIGAVNLSKTDTSTPYVFADCRALETIDKITVSENTIFSYWFDGCYALKEIRFEGVIGKSLDIHWSTKLSAESYYSIITALSSSVSGQKFIVPPTAEATYNANPPQGEGVPQTWAELIGKKSNWTIGES